MTNAVLKSLIANGNEGKDVNARIVAILEVTFTNKSESVQLIPCSSDEDMDKKIAEFTSNGLFECIVIHRPNESICRTVKYERKPVEDAGKREPSMEAALALNDVPATDSLSYGA